MNKSLLLLAVLLFVTALLDAQTTSNLSSDDSTGVEPVVATPKNTSPVSVGSNGLIFSSEDHGYRLQVHGYVQADNRMFSNNLQGEGLDQFLFRRIRPLFEGTLFNAVDFRFMPDFGQNNPQIQEAYLEFKSFAFAKLRVGKFKEPMGLEALKSDRELTFAERSLASDLVPLRYMGAQIGGALFSNSIAYQVGYFNGSNDGSNGKFEWIQGNEGVARVFFQPFATTKINAIRQFGFGVAGSAGAQHGTIAGLKTVGQNTFFKYSSTALANGQHNRVAPQAYYYWGPVGVLTEYVISSQEVVNKNIDGRLRNEAWVAEASVVLTGEKNSYGGIRPRYSFEPNKSFRRWGAVELALRSSQLRIDKDAFPLFANPKTSAQRATEWGVGLNWFLNRFVKLGTAYERTTFRMAPGNVTPLHSENVLMSRIQLAF